MKVGNLERNNAFSEISGNSLNVFKFLIFSEENIEISIGIKEMVSFLSFYSNWHWAFGTFEHWNWQGMQNLKFSRFLDPFSNGLNLILWEFELTLRKMQKFAKFWRNFHFILCLKLPENWVKRVKIKQNLKVLQSRGLFVGHLIRKNLHTLGQNWHNRLVFRI